VADTGPGMTADVRRRACEPFFSTRPGGLGIGLSLAQAIACAHGGILRIGGESVRGGYAAVCLPLTSNPAVVAHTAGADSTGKLR
jgi:signal transduction histidine kinase